MKPLQKLGIGVRILTARATGSARPFFVQYSLLNGCNAACVYCNSPSRPDPQLSTNDHFRILDDFARAGAVRIKLLGGEPLLRADIGEIVERVRRLGMRCAMVTNGFLVPAKLDVVRQLDETVISIDGRQQAHDGQRGRGTWARVIRAIELCAAEKLDFFLSAVVTAQSQTEIDWLLDLARRFNVMVNFQIPQFNPEMYGQAARTVMPSDHDLREIIEKIIAAKESGAPVLFSAQSYRQTLAWKDFATERIERPGQPTPCTAGTYFVHMEPNGDIYPCVLHIGRFTPKNALSDGLDAALAHAGSHSCFSCYNTWLNENRAIFDLQPAILMNFWRNYLRPSRSTAVPAP